MKVGIIAVLIVIFLAVSVQIFLVLRERNQLKNKFNDLNGRLGVLMKENEELRAKIEYFSQPENLEKELRARFNYKKAGEKMIIITP